MGYSHYTTKGIRLHMLHSRILVDTAGQSNEVYVEEISNTCTVLWRDYGVLISVHPCFALKSFMNSAKAITPSIGIEL